MIFIVMVSVCLIATVLYGVKSNNAKKDAKRYVQKCIMAGLLLLPVIGLTQGIFYSHGFDIHWSLFGLVNLIIIITTSIILVGLLKIYKIIKELFG